ncbi:MAG: hypothetical protein HQM11_14740 [SAR324 cluster bacterium]|nr:hypothetical protein [SAR324 cluster bacterium]
MGKVISFAEKRLQKAQEKQNFLLEGYLVWLKCPKCETLEYTEVRMPDGRIHNRCGSMVTECEVKIDIRAEYTIVTRNLKMLEKWFEKTDIPLEILRLLGPEKKMLVRVQQAELEYLRRLNIMALPHKVEPYPEEWEPDSSQKLKRLHPLGMIMSEARQPELHFDAQS